MEPTVMIVDDSPALRKVLQRVLRKARMGIGDIHEAGNGEEALEVLRANPVSLVLTEINMPKMDGLALLAVLKRSAPGLPVVIITTESGEAKVAEAVRLGADAYIRKPVTSDQIREKLGVFLQPASPV